VSTPDEPSQIETQSHRNQRRWQIELSGNRTKLRPARLPGAIVLSQFPDHPVEGFTGSCLKRQLFPWQLPRLDFHPVAWKCPVVRQNRKENFRGQSRNGRCKRSGEDFVAKTIPSSALAAQHFLKATRGLTDIVKQNRETKIA